MGWLYMRSLQGHDGPGAYLDAQFTYEREETTSKVLKSAFVTPRVYYAAVECVTKATGERVVWALVCLVYYNPRDREGFHLRVQRHRRSRWTLRSRMSRGYSRSLDRDELRICPRLAEALPRSRRSSTRKSCKAASPSRTNDHFRRAGALCGRPRLHHHAGRLQSSRPSSRHPLPGPRVRGILSHSQHQKS